MLFNILAATILLSLTSFVGVLALSLKRKSLDKIILSLVALSAGALMGGAFLHLLPEAMESGADVFTLALLGFIGFFLIEKVLHWRHCHKGKCDVHTFGYMNLVGDSVHNFVDGMIIAASFLSSVPLGIASTLAIAFHEIPQELGDFGVLVHSGFSVKKALGMNFLVAAAAIVGGFVGFLLSGQVSGFIGYLLPIAAGGFIYIAASDLIPEIRKTDSLKESVATMVMFVLGLAVMYAAKVWFL